MDNQRAAIAYDHPELGPMTITIAYEDRTEETLLDPIVEATVNATGEVVFVWADLGSYYGFGFAANSERNPTIKNPVDKRGHVFFEYEPGREPGVVYLVPTATGFRPGPEAGGVSLDDARVVDTDGDGNYEIDQRFYVCTTSCADGYSYANIWTWDGSAYTGSSVDPNLSAEQLARMEEVERIFTDYVSAANRGEYELAWGMLTESSQSNYGNLEGFRAFWGEMGEATIDEFRTFKLDDSSYPSLTVGFEAFVMYESGSNNTLIAAVVSDSPPKIEIINSY